MTQPELRREAASIARRRIVGKGLQNTCWYDHDHCSVHLKGPCGLELMEDLTESILQNRKEVSWLDESSSP